MTFPRALIICLALASLGCSEDKQTTSQPVVEQVSAGELIVKQNCKVCHAQGINGAPIIGNKKMWAGRADKDIAQLVNNATNGFGLMPAKGGNENLTEEEITEAVNFMVSRVKE